MCYTYYTSENNERDKMPTYKEHQLEARITDLEWQLSKIVAYVNETSVEEIVTAGKAEFGDSAGYAYAVGSLGGRLNWVRTLAEQILDKM